MQSRKLSKVLKLLPERKPAASRARRGWWSIGQQKPVDNIRARKLREM